MQEHAPDAVDMSDEDAQTLELYGVNNPQTEDFGRRCIIAPFVRSMRIFTHWINSELQLGNFLPSDACPYPSGKG